MAMFWYRDSPTSWHRATKFQISNALLHQVITQRSRKHKNQLPERCLNHWILVTNTYIHVFQLLEKQVLNNHNADALAAKILINIIFNDLVNFVQIFKLIDRYVRYDLLH